MDAVSKTQDFLLNCLDLLSAPICFTPRDYLLKNLPVEGESTRAEGMGTINLKHTRESLGHSDISIVALFVADYGTQVEHGSMASIKLSEAGDLISITIQNGSSIKCTYDNIEELNSNTIAGLVKSTLTAPAKDDLSCLDPLIQLSNHLKRNCTPSS